MPALLAVSGCFSTPTARLAFGHGPTFEVPGVTECTRASEEDILLDADEDLVLLVHGCNSSAAAFSTLSEVFAFHGQRSVCFTYDARSALDASARSLRDAVLRLEQGLGRGKLTVVGHSQGGLIARAALSSRMDTGTAPMPKRVERLVTVSSPFAGIESSRHCGLTWLHVVSLGATVAICQAITGTKWTEIYPGSDFTTKPGELASGVGSHLIVVTDERGSCLEEGAGNRCRRDDFVFTLEEQTAPQVEQSPKVSRERVRAGHVEIVGEQGNQPKKLIAVLQRQHVLRETPVTRRAELEQTLARLYGSPEIAPLEKQRGAPKDAASLGSTSPKAPQRL